MNKKLIIIPVAIALVAAAAWFGYSRSTVVASVNGQAITRAAFYEALERAAGQESLDRLITEALIRQEGQKQNLKPSAEEIKKEVDKVRAQFPSEEAFKEALKQAKLTQEDLQQDAEINLIFYKLSTKNVKVSDEEIKKFYDENKEALAQPQQIKARHILVNTEQEALDILAQLKKGGSFEQLAKDKSLDAANKNRGGDLGSFAKGKMVPDFDKVAFSLPVGQYSDPVKTNFGYHIIQVQERQETKVPALDEVKNDIRDNLIRQKAAPDQVIQDLKKSAKIEIRWDRYSELGNKK